MGFLRVSTPVPAHNGGKAQTNVDFASSIFDMWAIDQMKQSSGLGMTSVAADGNWPSRLNDDGFPTSMPSGGANWQSSQSYIYGVAGDVWVIDWVGTATVTMTWTFAGGGLSAANVISANRVEYTLTGSPVADATQGGAVGGPLKVAVIISAMSTPITSLRLYPKTIGGLPTDTTYLNQTDVTGIFHPSFLNKIKTIGVIRFLNWTQANTSRAMKWAHVRQESNLSWAGPTVQGSLWKGPAVKGTVNNTYTCPSSFGTLTNGQAISTTFPARPTFIIIDGTTNTCTAGNPTAFHITAHGLVSGDLVFFELSKEGGGSWTAIQNKVAATGLPATYTVTKVDNDNITINLNSSTFGAPTPPQNLYPRIMLSDGTTSKICFNPQLNNTINSEWSGLSYPGGAPSDVFTAIYSLEFDCFLLGGSPIAYLMPSMPISMMVKLCNYCKSHPWFVHPYCSEDDFWTQLATYVKANLAGYLVPRFESGNEIWNPGPSFPMTYYAQSISLKNYSVLNTDYPYAKRFVEVKALIEAVYGTGSNWQMILGCQLGGVSVNRLQGHANLNLGNPVNYPGNKADYIATAPYINILPVGNTNNIYGYPGARDQIDNYNQGGASRTTAFNWWLAEMQAPSTPGYGTGDGAIGSTVALAVTTMNGHATTISSGGYTGRRGTGLRRTHYEGGPTQMNIGTLAGGTQWISGTGFPGTAVQAPNRAITHPNAQAFYADWLESPQAGTLMTYYLTQMAATGVDYPSHFTLSSIWVVAPGGPTATNFGMWKNSNYSSSASSLYTAFITWNNP